MPTSPRKPTTPQKFDKNDSFCFHYPSPHGDIRTVGTPKLIVEMKLLPRRHRKTSSKLVWSDYPPLAKAAWKQLGQYFSGNLKTFDLPLKMEGTPFQIAVWKYLMRIPFGQTRSYTQVARGIGHPKACRAVGGANHRNNHPIVIPCHRVIGQGGELVGFGAGLPWKRALLRHEGLDF